MTHSNEVTATDGPSDANHPAGPGSDQHRATRIQLSSPGSIVASMPLLFGFHPEDSLVVLGLARSRAGARERIRHGVRIDLAQIKGHEREAAAELALRLHDQGADQALLIAYGPRGATGAKARPDSCRKLMAAVKAQLGAGPEGERIEVVDAVFTSGGRWWSYMCRNQRCCPDSGTVVPAAPPSALASHLAYQGVAVFDSRASLDATLAPYGGESARRMTAALAETAARFAFTVPAAAKSSTRASRPAKTAKTSKAALAKAAAATADAEAARAADPVRIALVASAAHLADELLARDVDADQTVTDADAALLLTALHEWQVRDHLACVAAEAEMAERLLILATELARRAPAPASAIAAYSLVAWAAWALGRSSLAQCAVDRALQIDATYNFATLIRAGLRHGITPENVRRSAENTRRELDGDAVGAAGSLGDSVGPEEAGDSADSGRALPSQRSREGAREGQGQQVRQGERDGQEG